MPVNSNGTQADQWGQMPNIPTNIRTRGWYGYYWARRTEQGHYEIRSVPPMLGQHSVPGGIMPNEGFEEHYEKVNPSYSGLRK
jgi:hypothetical protein